MFDQINVTLVSIILTERSYRQQNILKVVYVKTKKIIIYTYIMYTF